MNGRSASGDLVRIVAVALLAVLLGIALLYAYRSQTPTTPQVSTSTMLSEIQQGRVRDVAIDDGRATVTLTDGAVQRATFPKGDDQLARVVGERNAADPAHSIALRYEQTGPGVPMVFAVLGAVLPLLLLVTLVLLAAYAFDRGRAGRRYELLERIATLRDRGALSEDEFQAEKRRLLR